MAIPVGELSSSPLGSALLGGGLAGCVGKTATAPLQRLTVISQTRSLLKPSAHTCTVVEKTVVDGVRQIIRREGMVALWKGNACTCLHRFPFAGVNFAVFEYCKGRVGNSTFGRFFSGGAGGLAAVVACYPLDLVRTRIMTQMCAHEGYTSILDCVRRTAQCEGVMGLYKGMGTTLMLTVPALSISFGVYGMIKDAFVSLDYSDKSPIATIFAGGTGGVAGAAATFPMDVLRRRLQVMGMNSAIPQRSLRQEAAHLMKAEGLQGFWSGFKPEMIRAFPMVAITFLAYECFRPLPSQ